MRIRAGLIPFLLVCANSASAGNYEPPIINIVAPSPPTIAPVSWAGPYVGGLVSFNGSGEYTLLDVGEPVSVFRFDGNTSFGGFAGYNVQKGAFVYGGEVAANSGGLGDAGAGESFGPIFDVKARAGFALGNALIFGVAGGSFANFNVPPTETFATSGFTFGAGIDFKINQHMFIGAEYLVRDLSGGSNEDGDASITTSLQSTQLRIGWTF